MKDALYTLPKAIRKFLNPPLAAIGNIEDSYEEIHDKDSEGQGNEKIILASNMNDFYTRLEVLLR